VIFEFASFTAAQWIVLIGTFFTGIATVLTAIAALRRAKGETRTEVEIECLERLKVARLAESDAESEVYRLRKKYEKPE
jgi:hypothetical protein